MASPTKSQNMGQTFPVFPLSVSVLFVRQTPIKRDSTGYPEIPPPPSPVSPSSPQDLIPKTILDDIIWPVDIIPKTILDDIIWPVDIIPREVLINLFIEPLTPLEESLRLFDPLMAM